MHAIPEKLNNFRDAYPAPLRTLGKRRIAEDDGEEDSAHVERETCPFCRKTFANLSSHLAAWRKPILELAVTVTIFKKVKSGVTRRVKIFTMEPSLERRRRKDMRIEGILPDYSHPANHLTNEF